VVGGLGSGRFGRRTDRETTDDFPAIDVRRWQRDGLLEPGGWFDWRWTRHGEPAACAVVSVDEDRVTVGEAVVRLERTPGGFGGERAWFRCPECGRRCCLLYRRSGGFACRQCLGLAYQVEREGRQDRAARRARKIIDRARMDFGRIAGKPKWMRWPTYWRMSARVEKAALALLERDERLLALVRYADARQPRRRRARRPA